VVPELIMSMEGDKIDDGDNNEGDYVNLRDENGAGERCNLCGFYWGFGWSVFWYWVKLALLFTFIGLLAAACVMWVGPFLMDKVSFYKKVLCFCGFNFVCVVEFGGSGFACYRVICCCFFLYRLVAFHDKVDFYLNFDYFFCFANVYVIWIYSL